MNKKESNIIKGIAIILLLFHHLFYRMSNYDGYNVVFLGGEVEQNIITGAAVSSKVCVAMFAFLSAYGLSKQYITHYVLSNNLLIARDTFFRYIKLLINVICIYVPFALLTTVLQKHTVFEIYNSDNTLVSIKYFLLDLTGLAELFGTPKFNNTWWYLSLAILIIVTTPIINIIYKRIGWTIIAIAFICTVIFTPHHSIAIYYIWYSLGIVTAVILANENIIEKYKKHLNGTALKCLVYSIIMIVAILGFLYLRYKNLLSYYYADNIITVLIVFLVVSLSQFKILKYPLVVLETLGKVSMNIFLCHTFIYSYLFKNFIYSFKYWWLIVLILLIISGLIAWGLEKIKTVSGVYKLISIIGDKLVNRGGMNYE